MGLSAPAIARSHPLFDISLDLHAGEIVGVAGISGNGQDELFQCLAGLRTPSKGTIHLEDAALTGGDNAAFRRAGIGFISPDRANEGLAKTAPIADNVMAASQREKRYRFGPFLNPVAMAHAARDRLARLGVRYGRIADLAKSLSGGNQQRLVFAREIAAEPKLLIVAQPTRGVDLGGIAAIHGIIRAFASEGGAVLLVSEELDELMALSHRILVMAAGRVVGEVEADSATPEALGRLMLQSRAPEEQAA